MLMHQKSIMTNKFFSKIFKIDTTLTVEEIIFRLDKVNKVPTVSYWSDFERHSFKVIGKEFKLIKNKISEESAVAKGEIIENGEVRTVRVKLISYDTLMISILFIPIFVFGIFYYLIKQEWLFILILLLCLPVYYFLSFYMKKRNESRYILAFHHLLMNEPVK